MNKGYIIDIGATTIKFGVCGIDSDAPLIERGTPQKKEEIFSLIQRTIIDIKQLYPDTRNALAVACPGLVSDGLVTKAIYIDLSNTDVRKEISYICGCENVIVENDANFQAYGRYEGKNLLYVVIGSAVGGAYVDENGIFKGSHGFAAEFGHVYVDGGSQCYCGRNGCLDSLISGKRLEERLGKEWWNNSIDPTMENYLFSLGEKTFEAIETLSIMFDPSEICICGKLCGNNRFLDGIKTVQNKSTWVCSDIDFSLSSWNYVIKASYRFL